MKIIREILREREQSNNFNLSEANYGTEFAENGIKNKTRSNENNNCQLGICNFGFAVLLITAAASLASSRT